MLVTVSARLGVSGGELRVRNCCPKLVESEHAYEVLPMMQAGPEVKRLEKVVCRVELMEMMLLAGIALLPI